MPSKPEEKDTPDVGFAVPWIAKAFGVSPYKVRTGLADVQPKGKAGKAALYDLRDAAKVLVAKEVDWKEVLRNAKKSDLPASLQSEVWRARKIEMDYRKEAGELFEAGAVLELMSDCFAIIRNGVRLLPDSLKREAGLSEPQRHAAERMLDDTLAQWREKLLEHMRENNTPAIGHEAADE